MVNILRLHPKSGKQELECGYTKEKKYMQRKLNFLYEMVGNYFM
jgi:hypothetical protein